MANNNRDRSNQNQDRGKRSTGNQQSTIQTGGQNNGGKNRTADQDLSNAAPRSNSNRKDRGRGSR